METFSALLALCAGNSPVPVNSPHKGQWRGALMFSLICVLTNGWVNIGDAGDLRRYHAHFDITVMVCYSRSVSSAAMVSCAAFSPNTLFFVLCLLVGASLALTTTQSSPNTPELVECNETPPACNVSHKLTEAYYHRFTTPGHGHVESVKHVFMINTHDSVCSLDPISFVPDITNRSTPQCLCFSILCPPKPIRIVIRPSRNLTSPLVFAYLHISNCTLYWKDLSTFGQHVDIRTLLLLNWKDEFVEKQPTFFEQCMEFDDLQEGLDGMAPSISGLANVGTLMVSSCHQISCSDDSPIFYNSVPSPMFAHNMWPRMAEVVFVG